MDVRVCGAFRPSLLTAADDTPRNSLEACQTLIRSVASCHEPQVRVYRLSREKKRKKEKPRVEALNCLGAARVPPPGHSQGAAHLKTSHHGRSDVLQMETLHTETVSKILPALRSDAIMETLNRAGGRVFLHSSKFLKTCLSCFE